MGEAFKETIGQAHILNSLTCGRTAPLITHSCRAESSLPTVINASAQAFEGRGTRHWERVEPTMATPAASPFSASDAAIGYLYQVLVALLWTLRRRRDGSDFMVALETLDDVTFEKSGGAPPDLLQTKHHRKRNADLSDTSPDLWKSLRVWFEGHAAKSIASGSALNLLTTATAPLGSAAAYLRTTGRDVAAAATALEGTAQTSTNKANAPAYKAFLSTSAATRRSILDSVTVIDAAPACGDLGKELRNEVYWAAESAHLESFLDHLLGWWLRRAIRQLVDGEGILAAEVEAQMTDLREGYKRESLPIDEELLETSLDEATEKALSSRTFVMQIDLIKAGTKRVAGAIRDYYRAYEHRSRWLRDDLLGVGELDKYERRLVEEWELVFEAMRDEIGDTATDAAMAAAARGVLAWAEQCTIHLRPQMTEPFVARGSLHMLSDELRVGWHPEFQNRLASLLATRTGGS